ncbi:hypothetical protein Patl1_26255 [Pistacia atlantica]|uniref:Uncharacterized protein n=1 Tax=Pistacia atlantica TaxID=434234 RepID=A0ACC1B0H3_9ROSI|nr:hypothetical protein Patl1_26255 [Pistacia atlantica]
MLDILLRLPIKSLLRFKCVSKSWLSLILTHKFAITHLDKTSERFCRYGFIESKNLYRGRLSLYRLNDKGSSGASEAEATTVYDSSMIIDRYPTNEANIMGSCNGLLLLMRDFDTN